jgi:hypothetical protein
VSLAFPVTVLAQTAIIATQEQATIQFPDSITFSVDLQSASQIEQVVLEYRVVQVTCGEVVALAFPQFTPGAQVTATWTWEMRQSGSLPPGAKIYWLWHVTDEAGNTLSTQEQSITWLDSEHAWQTLSGTNVNLHWYDSPDAFGQELLDAALAALANLEQTTGLKPEEPIDLYIYASTDDLRQAILYEPSWTGGQAFAENDIVIIGISPGQIDWGKGAIAHELTHVLVGHLTFSCLGYLPGWLSEGLAMYGEGGLDAPSKARFDQAIQDNMLISVQSLSGGFSENPDKADISYSESYSLVNFLIDVYGKDPILALLNALQQGDTAEEALQSVYGWDINGLEDAWRAAIGAQPRQASQASVAATTTPTVVPTIVPVSAAAAGPTIAPTRVRGAPQADAPTEASLPDTPGPSPASQAATPQDTATIAAQAPTATRAASSPQASVTRQATTTSRATAIAQAAPTQASKASPTETPKPELSSPAWYSGMVRIIASGGAVCLILLCIAVVFFFTVIRPPRRRRQP